MKLTGIDHIVLTVRDIPATITFYESILGMRSEAFGEDRIALKFGRQKINLHQHQNEFEPKANNAIPGSADLCFISDMPLAWALEQVKKSGIEVIDGPVSRTGANGPIISFYIRDPDQNLIEISNYT